MEKLLVICYHTVTLGKENLSYNGLSSARTKIGGLIRASSPQSSSKLLKAYRRAELHDASPPSFPTDFIVSLPKSALDGFLPK
ncbi:hypothetical protein TcWFU_007683 [Taenia crassiceps]|uniref:Uncharacterized protein n=1 Tax=Taenia crassiceps TaxID=6207 RepID=A0ABR4QM12_9CEST